MVSNSSGIRLEMVTGRAGISFHSGDLKTLINKGNYLEGQITSSALATENGEAEEVSICLIVRTTALSYAILGFPVCLPDCTSP